MRPHIGMLLTILVSFSARAEWNSPGPKETILFAASELAIVADCWTTIDARNQGIRETNPILGDKPTTTKIVLLCGSALLLNGVAWYALPAPYRSILTGMVFFYEAEATAENYVVGARIRF